MFIRANKLFRIFLLIIDSIRIIEPSLLIGLFPIYSDKVKQKELPPKIIKFLKGSNIYELS